MTAISAEAQAIIDRLAAVDRETPVLDRSRAEAAVAGHFEALALEPLPVRWVTDGETGYRAAESAARSAAWSAAESAAQNAAWRHVPGVPEIDRWIGIWRPFVDAFEAGLWLFWVVEHEVIAVPRPALRIVDNRLHCEDGPAVSWPGGASYWFWRGVQVTEDVILRPQLIRPGQIAKERNVEVRRVLMERYGLNRFLREAGGKRIHSDDW